MNRRDVLAAVGTAFALASSAAAKDGELPLEEKVRKADVVIIGRVLKRAPVVPDPYTKFISVRTEFVLKGNPPREILVMVEHGIGAPLIKNPKHGAVGLFMLRDFHGANAYGPDLDYTSVYLVADGKN